MARAGASGCLALAVALALAAGDSAASVHPLAGNGRFQLGDGVPVPVTFVPPPVGRLLVVPGAVVVQSGTDPMTLRIPNAAMKAAPIPWVIPVSIGQVQTEIGITYPTSPSSLNTLSAGGRSGASTVSWCPGNGAVTPTGNPACPVGSMAPHPSVKGIMIYTRTQAQFGGALRGRFYGRADVALPADILPPCSNCRWRMASVRPDGTGSGAVGNRFGGMHATPGTPPVSGVLLADATAGGLLFNVTPTTMGDPGYPNPLTAFGGPWTTGRVTVSAPFALGMAEVFVLSGSDARVDGVGSLSLVAGGLSNRRVQGTNANRGWLNLTIGAPLGALPSMGIAAGTAVVVSLGVAGAMRLRRRGSGGVRGTHAPKEPR